MIPGQGERHAVIAQFTDQLDDFFRAIPSIDVVAHEHEPAAFHMAPGAAASPVVQPSKQAHEADVHPVHIPDEVNAFHQTECTFSSITTGD